MTPARSRSGVHAEPADPSRSTTAATRDAHGRRSAARSPSRSTTAATPHYGHSRTAGRGRRPRASRHAADVPATGTLAVLPGLSGRSRRTHMTITAGPTIADAPLVAGRSRGLGRHDRRARPAALEDRADRQRELRRPGGPRGAGLVAHQQVRRGPAGQALLRRLRVRGRGRAAGPGACPGPLPGRRARQRPAPLGCPGQHGRLLQRAQAGRPDPGHEPGPRRPPDPRHGPQLLGQAVRGPRLRGPRGRPAHRLRRPRAPGAGGAPRDDRGGRQRLPPHHRLRADGGHRPRRGRAAVRGHGPHRGPGRGGPASEPVPARGPGDHDHPQDAAGPARRHHLRPRRASARPSTRRSSRASRADR